MGNLKINPEWVRIMEHCTDEMQTSGMSRSDAVIFAEIRLFKKAIGNVISGAHTELSDYVEYYIESQARLVEKSRALDENTREFVDAIRVFGYDSDVDMAVIKKDARCKTALSSYKEPAYSPNTVFDTTKEWRRSSYDSQSLVRGSLACFYERTGFVPSDIVQSFLDDTSLFDSLAEEFGELKDERRVPDVSDLEDCDDAVPSFDCR